MNWIEYYMRGAYWVSTKSKDPRTKIGTLIIKNNRLISSGFNGIPIGVKDNLERLERPLKYSFISHSERNAIYSAANLGNVISESLLFTLAQPCIECTKAIIQSGISEIYIHKQFQYFCELSKREQWVGHDEISKIMLTEAGIKINIFDQILNIETLFDGKIISV